MLAGCLQVDPSTVSSSLSQAANDATSTVCRLSCRRPAGSHGLDSCMRPPPALGAPGLAVGGALPSGFRVMDQHSSSLTRQLMHSLHQVKETNVSSSASSSARSGAG